MTVFPTLFYASARKKSLPSYIPQSWKRYPFRAEPTRLVHYREYTSSPSPSRENSGRSKALWYLPPLLSNSSISRRFEVSPILETFLCFTPFLTANDTLFLFNPDHLLLLRFSAILFCDVSLKSRDVTIADGSSILSAIGSAVFAVTEIALSTVVLSHVTCAIGSCLSFWFVSSHVTSDVDSFSSSLFVL